MPLMPDAPKRCWYCEREMTIETIRVECAYCGADVARVYEWLDALDAARAEAERWRDENEMLYRRIERLEAKVARQRVMLTRLQAAIERRATGDWVEATRRAMADEVVERYVREADVALDEAERWRQKYEALRAGVEQILKQIEAAPKPEEFIPTNPDEMMTELLYAMRGGKGHNKGFANGLWVAGMMLRGLLSEAGGGDT